MPYAALVIARGSSYPLREFTTAVEHELERQGVPCTSYESFPAPRPDQVYILVSPREFVACEGNSALPEQSVLDRTVMLTAERPEDLSGPDAVTLHRRAGAVFDISQRAVLRLHQLGISARLLRPGYSQPLDHYDASAERPIDVMFLGADSSYRRARLSALSDVLARHACVLQVARPPLPSGDTTDFLAASRWSLLARTKVLVNLRRDGHVPMEWLRMMDAFHSGAVLLSEPAGQVLPFVAGEHFLVARPGVMGHVLETLLHDEARLAAVREAAYERLNRWLPLAASVAVLRAALVELVGRPIREAAHLGIGAPPTSPSAPTPMPEEAGLRAELQDTRRELVGLRYQLARLGQAVAESAGADRVQLSERNGSWRARRSSRVTVLLSLGEHAADARATLESLAVGHMADRELVAVGATGSMALAAAQEWVRAHPRIPATVLAAPPGTLRGPRLRLGLDVARAPLCLVIDAGQRIFPRTIAALVSALSGANEADFVYPIQAVRSQNRISGPVEGTLLNLVDCSRPHQAAVAAPALARTAVLRAVLHDAEPDPLAAERETDLWDRLVRRGSLGRLVPEILAWRPGSAEAAPPVGAER